MLPQPAQPAILAELPPCGRSMVFRLSAGADARPSLAALAAGFSLDRGVVAVGAALATELGHPIPGLRDFPALASPAGTIPSTQGDLWVFLRAADRAGIFDRSVEIVNLLGAAFELIDAMDTFAYGGRDLTGYVDGTENPTGEKRISATLVKGKPGLDGSSFVGVQRWTHDLTVFHRHSPEDRDNMIGRRREDDEEIEDAPPSAHVKRTAQEDFDPEAFMFRRSMPWSDTRRNGLEFIAYARSFGPFDQMLQRMTGLEDGIIDALFTFSRPITGGYYWCPPVKGDQLDFSALGL